MMQSITDPWFDERVKDEIATREQVEALKNYLNNDSPLGETAETIAAGVNRAAEAEGSSVEDIVEQLCLLWTLIIDAISDWPQLHSKVILLLDAIRKLPHIDHVDKDGIESFRDDAGTVREAELWEDLPKFWNLLSDEWDAKAAWRKGGQKSDLKDVGSSSWSNINIFAAVAFKSEAFRKMRFLGERGCWILKTSAAPNSDLINIDVPAAAGWIRIAGPELYNFYMTNLAGSSLEKWTAWQAEFAKVSNNTYVKQEIRNDAGDIAAAMHNMGCE